jgi:predicted nucleic acid-binding protein
MRIVLDTSVISAYYDKRQPERRKLTQEFLNSLGRYNVAISIITREELEQITDQDVREQCLELIRAFQILPITEPIKLLAQLYLKAQIVPVEYANDALLIATATTNNSEYLVSWNFKHMVNLKVMSKVNAINALSNFSSIDIVSPGELL